MPSIHILEPHPSVPKRNTHVLSSGIGGAGNYHTYAPTLFTHGPEATGPAFASRRPPPPNVLTSSTTTSTPKQPKIRMSGRGGAGNARPTTIHRPFDLEADLRRAEQREAEREERRRLSLAIVPTAASARRSSSVYHVGRGGAGNAFDEDEEVTRFRRQAGKGGDGGSVSSAGSGSTAGSGRWDGRLSRMFSRE